MRVSIFIIYLLICTAQWGWGGDPIEFSEPRRSVKTPATDPVEALLNKPLERFNPGNSLGDPVTPSFPLPQPIIVVPKKTKQEDSADNIFFRNEKTLLDSADSSQFNIPNSLNELSGRKNLSPVEQYLLRQEKISLMEKQKHQASQKQSNIFEAKDEQSKFRNPGLFGNNLGLDSDRNPFDFRRIGARIPGMETGMMEKLGIDAGIKTLMELREKELAEKQNKEKLEAFRRLLGDPSSYQMNTVSPRDMMNSAQDLTRRNDNPVAVSPNERMNFVDRKNPRLNFEDSKNMRSRLSAPNEAINNPYQQNRTFLHDFQQETLSDREKQKPRPPMNPIPRRPF